MIYSVSCYHHAPFRFARDPDTALIQELDVLFHPPPRPLRTFEAHYYRGRRTSCRADQGQQFSIATSVSAHTNFTERETLRSSDEQHMFSSRQEDDDNAHKGCLNQLTCLWVAA
jgi:hypothetical protein